MACFLPTGYAATAWIQNLLRAIRRRKTGETFLSAFHQKSRVSAGDSAGSGGGTGLHDRHRGE